MVKVKIREAVAADIPTLARIGADAFQEEPIYEHFFPRRDRHALDYRRFFLHDLRRMLYTPGQIIVVAEQAQAPQESASAVALEKTLPKVVGYATFIRTGSKKELATWKPDSWRKKCCRFTVWLSQLVCLALAPNRAVSLATINAYYRQAEAIHAPYLKETTSKIDFKTLAVDMDYQRQGIGAQLVEWCGMRARTENVQVFGDSSTKGLPLYSRNGCKEIGRIHLPKQVAREKEIGAMDVVVLRWQA
ncbi:hypothetical protein BKA66DRAFT_434298 [Pyrenochaeta sp. MPI-SDFR-AT-0127]|nr:hypothetical protein BKA66DRAFT_434298 [Pyrenochaeta sp. MPI-SDFR-AT-0127]